MKVVEGMLGWWAVAFEVTLGGGLTSAFELRLRMRALLRWKGAAGLEVRNSPGVALRGRRPAAGAVWRLQWGVWSAHVLLEIGRGSWCVEVSGNRQTVPEVAIPPPTCDASVPP